MPHTAKVFSPAGVGLLTDEEELTVAARDSFTLQVVTLLTSGNANGLGAKVSSILGIPFPPPAGVKLLDPDRLLTHPSPRSLTTSSATPKAATKRSSSTTCTRR